MMNDPGVPSTAEEHRTRPSARPQGSLVHAENLAFLGALSDRALPKRLSRVSGAIRLAYLDPPFMTGRDRGKPFVAPMSWRRAGLPERLGGSGIYGDRWKSLDEYLAFLEARLCLLRDVLSPDGSVYLHLDQRVSHYAKVMMDRIFGPANFRNEIVWRYVSGGVARRHFARKHDTILFYTRSKDYVFRPQKERKPAFEGFDAPHGRDEKGEFVWYIRPGTNPKVPKGVRKYLDGFVSDVWYIPMVNPQAKERRAAGLFPTQKPSALLERIVLASSEPGDTVFDPFCGSGTTALAAVSLGRRFLCVDSALEAVNVSMERLLDAGHGTERYSWDAVPSTGGLRVAVKAERGNAVVEVQGLRPEVPGRLSDAFARAKDRLKRTEFVRSLVRIVSVGATLRGGRFRGLSRAFDLQGAPPRPALQVPSGYLSEVRVLDLFGGWHAAQVQPPSGA